MSAKVRDLSLSSPFVLIWGNSEIDVPIRLNCAEHEIWIRPGDIIIGDADGVVCLPRSLASNVLEILPKLVAG